MGAQRNKLQFISIQSKMDEYRISSIPERFLNTQHYQSSIDEPNLDNVQAKLLVARQRNHELAMQYFRNKYGSAAPYQQFTKHHNMGQRISNQALSNQQALRLHLQRKAKQIQKNFYNQQSYEQQNDKVNMHSPQWVKKHEERKKNNNNPWIKVSKVDDKHKRNETQQQKFVDSAKNPKNRQSQFLHQFKNYLHNKQKQKQQQRNKIENNQSMNRTMQSKFESSKIVNKYNISQIDRSPPKRKCYQQELAKKIFKEILGDCKDSSTVQKLVLLQYIMNNKKIMKVLGFTQSQLNNAIIKQQKTKAQNQISLQQFVFFILKAVGKQKQINEIKQERRQKNVPEGCMLSKQLILHFEKVFKQLDSHTDLIVKRLLYIDRLANDPLIKNQLNSPAVYEPQMEKSITLRRIFQRIQMQCLFGDEDQQRAKQYISWNQFLDYFKSGQSPQSTYNMVTLINSLHKSQAMGLVEVPDIVMQIISEASSKSVPKSGYYNTLALIQKIIKNPEYDHEKYAQVRQQSKIANLPSQTFQEVLARIKKSGQNFVSLKEFLQYFSNKGRPIQQFQLDKMNASKKNFSAAKVKFLGDEITNKNQILDGYDSDPQIYQSKIMNKNSPRKSGRSTKKLEHSNSVIQQSKISPDHKRQLKVTIPVPFSFQERQKNRLKQKQQNKSEIKQFQHFKAQPIPEKVLQKGLYYKMLQEDQKKIQQRKKSCMIMTLANEQPFNFMKRKVNKKTKQERQQFAFKAKPIPWYCSVDLLEKKREAQIIRNQKIAKQAQQNLAKAKLPPRMERDYQQKQAKQALAQYQKTQKPASKPKGYREPPDFDKLHRQFEQGLERKRKQNKTTIPQQFNFANRTSSRPKTAFNKTEAQMINENQQKLKSDSYKKIFESKPAASSTIKYDQQVEKRRQQMEKKRKQEQEKKIQDEKRKLIDEQLKNKLMMATKNKQNSQKQQREKRNKEMQEQMQNFKNWKKQRIQKGRQQPMLINRPLKRDEKIEKMRKLYQISQTLKGNGIKDKEHDAYFNRQQLLLLQDWEQLKNKL